MALVATLTLTANGRVLFNAKNSRTGVAQRYTFVAFGDFGGGTLEVQLSADGGTTWVSDITDTGALQLIGDGARNIEVNSHESDPVKVGFELSGGSSPDITIKVYNTV